MSTFMDKFIDHYIYLYMGIVASVHVILAFSIDYNTACLVLDLIFIASLILHHIANTNFKDLRYSANKSTFKNSHSVLYSFLTYTVMAVVTLYAPVVLSLCIYALTAIFVYMRKGIESGRIL